MNAITEQDIQGEPLIGQTVAVIGFGSQGSAHALNLRDSGVDVVVGLRPESLSRSKAELAGVRVLDIPSAVEVGDIVALMIPDECMSEVFSSAVNPFLRKGATLLFAHGFAVRYGVITPPDGVDIVMVAPMGPGMRLRERFQEGTGLPASFAIERDATGRARRTALEYAKAVGCARVAIFETTFDEETEIDLFAEQAVLVGGVTELIEAGYETLVEAGYSPELAYMECVYELDLTVNLIRRFGISGMHKRISKAALYGSLTRGTRVVGSSVREGMRAILAEIRDGRFAEEFLKDGRDGKPELRRRLKEEEEKPIEETAGVLRKHAHEG
jgi:ketol-acid reductoisomerase